MTIPVFVYVDLASVAVRRIDDIQFDESAATGKGPVRRRTSTTLAAADLSTPAAAQYRKAITTAVIGNVLEWYDFGVYGYLVSTISQLFFPSGDPAVSLLSTCAVFGVGFLMRPVGSIPFAIYGDRHGCRKALSAVVFVMALATFAMGLLPTYGRAGVLAPALLVLVRLFQGLSAGGEWGGSTAYIVEFAPEARRGSFAPGSWSGSAAAFCSAR